MSKLKCVLNIASHSPHIVQIVAGFFELQKQNIIDLKINYISNIQDYFPFPNMLEVIIENKYKVAYDVEDGYNIDKEQVEKYLETVNFYFKRSYKLDCHKYFKYSERIYPLGFNYHVTTKGNITDKVVFDSFNRFLKSFGKKILKWNNNYYIEKFEDLPRYTENPQILFTARVWDANEFKIRDCELEYLASLKEEREYINNTRAECIRLLRKEYGKRFIGGLSPTDYAKENFSDCVIDKSLTNRVNFIELVKKSSICISTMGLHKSNGWKLAEYIAASKAIVSEKLYYEVPGDFKNDQNYLEFNSPDKCIEKVEKLITDKEFAYKMQVNNYIYYHNYLRPDRLILNSLCVIFDKIHIGD